MSDFGTGQFGLGVFGVGTVPQAGVTGWITASAEGSALIDSGTPHAITFVQYFVREITSPRVRTMGTIFPRRLQYAGSLLLTIAAPDSSDIVRDFSIWQVAINLEGELIMLHPENQMADSIGWRLPTGIEVDVRVTW